MQIREGSIISIKIPSGLIMNCASLTILSNALKSFSKEYASNFTSQVIFLMWALVRWSNICFSILLFFWIASF